MIEFTVFDKTSGKVLRTGCCPDDMFDIQAQENSITEGIYPDDKFYWQGGDFVEMPEKPGTFYEFDYTTKTWVYNQPQAEKYALAKRDRLLAEGPDRISPMWWASMTEQEQQAWTFYRQALLDITEQADYPEFIVWPIKP